MPEKTKTIILTREKETRNAVRFAEVPAQGEAPIVGTIYVQRWYAAACQNLKVTITAQ